MFQIEHCQSDLRQSSPDNAPNHTHNEESKVTLTVPELPGTNRNTYRAEQNHATNTTRENAIASLIVLANLVPVYNLDHLP